MSRRSERIEEVRKLSRQLNSPQSNRRWTSRVLLTIGRAASWVVMAPPRKGLQVWSGLRPTQQLVLGFAGNVLLGTLLLCLPLAQARPTGLIDNLFSATSAVSTTGLMTVGVSENYTIFGQLVLLVLFQLGGIGFMTLSSLFILARGGTISHSRLSVLQAGFAVPHYFVMQRFIVHVVAFTASCELIGTTILWWRFSSLGVDQALWTALFHSVSAFATAGFSLYSDSLERFSGDWVINFTIAGLCYMGAIGFIVFQDIWYSIKHRERMLTFTSKVILCMTAGIFGVGTILLLLTEPSVAGLSLLDRFMVCAFQCMTAATTAGFNTVPVGSFSTPALLVLLAAMIIGASPSGTGGGIKTTTAAALLANLMSVLRGRDRVLLLGNEIPMIRVLFAVAAATFYLAHLGVGVFVLSMTERLPLWSVLFEAASAIGTVGLSLGVTPEISAAGKFTLVALMFAGRLGPLTIGLALLRPDPDAGSPGRDDLAV